MPYPAGHRERVRGRIVDSARQLFNRGGFESVTVSSIMNHAGLTHGAFYSYFESKSDLYAEVLGCFFTDPTWKNRWEGVDIDPDSPDLATQIVLAYLSRQHYENVEHSCPMVALPSDVARSGARVKAAFEDVFRAMVSLLSREVHSSDQPAEERAMAVAALCIGGMVVARSLNDPDLADRLRDAAANAALKLGGWKSQPEQANVTRRAKRKPGQPSPHATPERSSRRKPR